MILDKEIEIKISNSNIRYFKDKYKCKSGEKIIVKVSDLNKNSNFRINCKCDVCGKETNIKYQAYNLNIEKYGIYSCSRKCAQIKSEKTCLKKYGVENPMFSKEIKEKLKNSIQEKYNVDNVFQNEEIKEKIKETNLKKFGFKNAIQNENIFNKVKQTNLKRYGFEYLLKNKNILNKVKKTNLERYGVEYIGQCEKIKEKVKQTNLKRYGTEYSFQSEIIKEKIKKTNLKRYGVENPTQNLDILNKSFKTAIKIFKYKETNLYYQGSYEKDFLDKFYSKVEIENGKTFDYFFKNINRKYFSDFFLPKYNLILEIKSKYTYEIEKEQNLLKKNSAVNNGYNFLFIIDKNYNELLEII